MRLWLQKFVPLRQASLFISFCDIQAPTHHLHKHLASRDRRGASLHVRSVANSCPSGFAGSANTQGNTTVVNSSPTYKTTIRQLEDNYKTTIRQRIRQPHKMCCSSGKKRVLRRTPFPTGKRLWSQPLRLVGVSAKI